MSGPPPEGPAPDPAPPSGTGPPPASANTAPPTATSVTRFPEVWSRRQDLPGMPWCVAKGIAKGILLIFFLVLLPIEFLFTILGAADLWVHHSISVALLVYGGGALAVTSAGFTAFQTTSAYGFFRLANRVAKLVYLYVLAAVAIFTIGPLNVQIGSASAGVTLQFNVADVFYLFMIPVTFAAAASAVTLYEDLKHPGERFPWDFPISRRQRRKRESEMAAHLGIPPPP